LLRGSDVDYVGECSVLQERKSCGHSPLDLGAAVHVPALLLHLLRLSGRYRHHASRCQRGPSPVAAY
jgi:hypothetical protein